MAITHTPPTRDALPAEELDATVEALRTAGVRVLRGTFVDSAGVIRAKQVPVARAGAFHRPGLGASPTLAVLCADDAVALTPSFSVVGDMRLSVDLRAVVDLGDGVAWAPIELTDQEGEPMPFCWRGALRRQLAELERDGVTALSATEIEFVVLNEAGEVAGSGKPGYGITPLLDHAGFVDDVHRDFEAAGLEVEQLHAEYAHGQFELSLAPAAPLRSADVTVLARILLGRCARRHGLRTSFSPLPHLGDLGNGAHVHLSFRRDGAALLSGGDGPHGLTAEGGSLVAGLVRSLPEITAALAPSLLSTLRLQPGHFAGAFACWGLENREAAVRLCAGTPGNPRGGHVEVKCVDPSANPYVAQAALLGAAAQGLRDELEPPAETTLDPGTLDETERERRGIRSIAFDQANALDRLESSALMGAVLGAPLVETLVAVRRHEVEVARAVPEEELVARFRYAWSA